MNYIDFIKEKLPMITNEKAEEILNKCNYKHDTETQVKEQILLNIKQLINNKEIEL